MSGLVGTFRPSRATASLRILRLRPGPSLQPVRGRAAPVMRIGGAAFSRESYAGTPCPQGKNRYPSVVDILRRHASHLGRPLVRSDSPFF